MLRGHAPQNRSDFFAGNIEASKAAEALGLTIQEAFLLRADEVIESVPFVAVHESASGG